MKHYDDVVAAAAAVVVATWHADNNGHKPEHWEKYYMKFNIEKNQIKIIIIKIYYPLMDINQDF